MKTYKILLFAILMGIFGACSSEKKESNTHNKGVITLEYDDAHSNVAKALASRYQSAYPETEIHHKTIKEDQALENLLNHKVDMIIMSRELTSKEREYWDKKTQLPWQPSYFAADAVCFVVDKNAPKEYLTLEEIKSMLQSPEKNLIFEGSNTSNFNKVVGELQLVPEKVHYFKIEGNENIINSLEKHPQRVGVISFNTISHPYDSKTKELKEKIKILPIKVGDSLLLPNKENLKSQKYPFTKLLYFLTNEKKFGLANGVIRYSCTHTGQKIVSKEGLQPFNLYPRTIKINTQN